MVVTQNDIAKLPKWAQKFINDQQYKLNNLEERIKELEKGEGEPSLVYVSDYKRNSMYLSDAASVKFTLENGSLEFSIKDGGINVYASKKYNEHLAVIPEISNVLTIKLIKSNS